MGSSRLSGKTLKVVDGKPIIEWLIDRISPSKHLDEIVVATSVNKSDDPIVRFCKKKEIKFFRGSEEDLLGRVYQAAKRFKSDAVVRIGPDNPFIDVNFVTEFCQSFLKYKPDYVCNFIKMTYPYGINMDMYSINFLAYLNNVVTDPYDREHVSPYPIRHRNSFKVVSLSLDKDYSSAYRLTVDYPQDLELAKKIFTHFGDRYFSYWEVVKYLDEHPEIKKINADIRTIHHGTKK